ncbi:GNAT family N-acetyltransferase [Microbulbifer marinus]|uniref:Acetyltransferase (GNAT) family protein n=1 Tax=Microbulbifer marinus TaxID=658218 RepID=A0A1H3ZBJ6_9GAMM|nr:GNAT family N-acetyltransferase [Microbulbifer marinus]SEA21159.1 Acetyltransferase (GNAT) family protein [Microbulbifer marinus]
MELVPATEAHLRSVMEWLPDARACKQWGGPTFRYPFTVEAFLDDCRWQELPSYALVDASGTPCAFGQYYNRLDHCHLGRLIVSPQMRGRGLGRQLIRLLVERGCNALRLDRCSLFVLRNNHAPRALYERLGFALCDYPESPDWLADCHYMVAPAKIINEEGISN